MRTSPGVTAQRLLGHLIHEGPAYRADLSRALGVSRTTVTNLVTELTDSGVLAALDRNPGSAATPGHERSVLKQSIGISPDRGVLVSVVLRMTSTAVVIGSLDGRVLEASVKACARDQPGLQRMDDARSLLDQALAACGTGAGQVLRLHLAVNTQCDRESGEVITEHAAGLWRGINPKQIATGWSPAPVLVENTARLTGLAEYHALRLPRPASLVYVHLSWGVTMGQVVDGEVLSGSHGGAGEIGHVSIDPMGPPCACGNRGCLMLYAGLDTVMERIRATLGVHAGIDDAIAAVAAGSHACSTIIADAGQHVGEALAMVCNVVDPDAIVVGGELAATGRLLLDAVRAAVLRRSLPLVTRRLDLTLAGTAEDPFAAGRSAVTSMRTDGASSGELISAILRS